MEWIKVEDRLPEHDVMVIVFEAYKSKTQTEEFAHTARLMSFEVFKDKTVINWHDLAYSEGKITHWMPLPEPPQP